MSIFWEVVDPLPFTAVNFHFGMNLYRRTLAILLIIHLCKKMSEKFCLKWNDFHSNVSKSFGLFRNEEYLHDVTIVGNDNRQVPAHKLVLSACSEYFRNIFKNNKHPQTLVCIDGIASEELGNIMDYIYNGEVQIFQESLDRFLSIAQRLQLNGLIGNDNENVHVKENEMKEVFEEENDNLTSVYQEKMENQITNKSIVGQTQAQRKIRNTNEKQTIAINGEDNIEIDSKVNEYLETLSDGSLKCTLCGKIASKTNMKQSIKQNMTNHVETHLDGVSYRCQICGKDFRSKNSLNNHKSLFHRPNK